jgi:transcriptional regulator with XRE-family HTH domain
MEEWHTRLGRRIEERGWTVAEFARRAGLPVSRVYKYVQGRVKRPPSNRTIEALARAVDWTPAMLMYGTAASSQASQAEVPERLNEEPLSMRRIPKIQWGEIGMLTTSPNGARTARVKSSMPVPPEEDVSEGAFYTIAPDDANAPEIAKGALLICDPGLEPVPGYYVIALIKGHEKPVLAKYVVERYRDGAPADIALVHGDELHYGRHQLQAANVRIIGPITHVTSRMLPARR